MNLIKYLKEDKDLIEMRKEWKEKFKEPFPPFNNDEYMGIDSYKEEIRELLDAENNK